MSEVAFIGVYAVVGLIAFVAIARHEARELGPSPSDADQFGGQAVAFLGALMWPLAAALYAAGTCYRAVTRDIY